MRKFKVGDKVKCTGLSCFGKDLTGKSGGITDFTLFFDEKVTVAAVFVPKLDNYFLVRFSDMKLLKPKPTRKQLKQLKQRIKELEAQLSDSDAVKVGDDAFIKEGAPYLKEGTEVTVDRIQEATADIHMVASIPTKYLEKL